VQSGLPLGCDARSLPIPFLFLPNIVTRVTVSNGGPVVIPGFTLAASDAIGQYLAVRMTFQGYKLTMPV
jgi:hypothetical protein